MALATYSDLQTSIAAWLHRTDLTAVIPDFIALAEARMNSDFNTRSNETRVTLTCVPGTTVAARYVALPTDFTEMKRLTLMTDPSQVLIYKSPDEIVTENSFLLTAGRPTSFTVVAGNIELAPPPDSAYSLELVYFQTIPALSVSNPTNWVLTKFPSAYLYGALVAATAYTQDEADLQAWEKKYQEAVLGANSIDWYSGSTMRVRSK